MFMEIKILLVKIIGAIRRKLCFSLWICFFGLIRITRSKEFSVADPGCLFRILIFIYPGSRISDPTNSNKRGTKLAVLLFSVATNFSKLKITYFVSEQMQKKICATRQKIIVTKLSNIFVGDQVTETRDPEKNLSRIQCSKMHRIPNPGSASLLRKMYTVICNILGQFFQIFKETLQCSL
jgi:hypothetical protein